MEREYSRDRWPRLVQMDVLWPHLDRYECFLSLAYLARKLPRAREMNR